MRNPFLSLLLLLCACGGVKLDPASPYRVRAVQTEAVLTDTVTTQVEISYPDKGKGPHPTVVLVPSSGPMDMDHTITSDDGLTLLFSDLADELSSRGFAVVRYHKRHVTGFKEFDLPKFVRDDQPALQAADLVKVLEATRAHPRVDANKVFLYGFGEGAQVAAQVATERPIAGLLLHSAPGTSYPKRMDRWFRELLVPHLEGHGFRGVLNGLMLAQALQRPLPLPVRQVGEMLAVSYTRDAEVMKISPLVDLDRNGLLELEMELEPRIPDLIDLAFGPIGNLRQHAGKNALPTVDAQVGSIQAPVLVLQGMMDATHGPENADAIEKALQAASHPDYAIARFEGVGHTLSMTPSPLSDLPRPMAIIPRDTIVDWLVTRAR